MKKIQNVVDKDPLNFKNVATQDRHKKILYGLIVAVLICFILALLFFIIGLAVSSASSSNEKSGVVVTDSEGKQVVLSQTEIDQRYEQIGKSPSDIRTLMKIMPSSNTKKNVIFMDYVNKTGKSKDQSYHNFNNTKNYFTTLRFDDNHVPAGDSKTLCVHVLWTTINHEEQIDEYEGVQDFPVCSNSQNNKMRWNEHDPTTGIDIKAWDEIKVSMSCSSDKKCRSSCKSKGGIYGIVGGVRVGCFKYKILKKFCIKIEPKVATPYGWRYAGGCFSGKSPTQYEYAKAGSTYYFRQIPMEVRTVTQDKQTIFPTVIRAPLLGASQRGPRYQNYTANSILQAEEEQAAMTEGGEEEEERGVLGWISFILFFLGLIGLIVFGFLYFYWWQKKNESESYQKQEDEIPDPNRGPAAGAQPGAGGYDDVWG